MARKSQDSDSDEYEFMTPMSVAELCKENKLLHQIAVERSSNAQMVDSTNSKLSTVEKNAKDYKEDVALKKPKKKFMRHFTKGKAKDKEGKAIAKSSSFSVKKQDHSQSNLVTITSPQTSSDSVMIQQRHQLPTQFLTLDAPPNTGPKPARRITDEEKLEQVRRKQKEIIAAARQDRLRRCSEPNPTSSSHQSDYLLEYMIDHSYGEVEVTDIVNQYIDHLPLEVVVSKGVYGMEERYSLSTSDKCVIHFVKKRDLVRIQDPQTNREFSVPLSSAIKFSIIYNPNNDEEHARTGFKFPLVSDILAMTPLPKMGLAHLTDPNIEGLKSTELLVIKEVIFPDNPQDPRKLRVYSLTAKCQKDLLETQEVRMSTNPSFMQVYLPDIMKHVPNPSSLHVQMYRNPLTRPLVAPGIPGSMFRRPLYLKNSFTDILLIATGTSDGADGEDNCQPFEIPTDIDVEFEVIKHTPEDKEKLVEQSRKLVEQLKEKDIRHHRYAGVSEEEHRMQMSLYKSIREGVELKGGVTLEEAVDGDYVKATSGNRLALNHRVDLLEENIKRCCQLLTESKATIEVLTQDNITLTKRVSHLEEQLSERRMEEGQVNSIARQLDNIYNELDELRTKSSPKVVHQKQDSKSPKSTFLAKTPPLVQKNLYPQPEKNRELLSRMTLSEVLRMLQLAGLSQYNEIFTAEQVSGEVLLECDEGMLENELGIKSKIHRLKFLTVIGGNASEDMYKLVD